MPEPTRKEIEKIITKMQMRISDAYQAWDGAESYDVDEMWEKYGDETDAAENEATTAIMTLLERQDRASRFDELEQWRDELHNYNMGEEIDYRLKELKSQEDV